MAPSHLLPPRARRPPWPPPWPHRATPAHPVDGLSPAQPLMPSGAPAFEQARRHCRDQFQIAHRPGADAGAPPSSVARGCRCGSGPRPWDQGGAGPAASLADGIEQQPSLTHACSLADGPGPFIHDFS
ncbi:hypothetical protein VPH35_051575 [Triticum aestivum]